MNENTNPLHRPLAVGDWVIVARGEEYAGLSGQITEIHKRGSPEHDTGNPKDDIIVDLSVLDYSDSMMSEITALMKELGYEVESYDDVSIDSVILSPDDLIQITDDELQKHHTELVASIERASVIGEGLSVRHFDEIYSTFINRVEKNNADYEHEILDEFGAKGIFDMAARIHAVSDAYSYLTVYQNFSEEELRFYLQFKNPLAVVAHEWHKRNIDVGDMSYTLDYMWERRDDLMQEHTLIDEAKVEPEKPMWAKLPEPVAPKESLTAQERLLKKMSAEYDSFIAEMKLKPASKIIEAGYEKTFKEDLLLTVEDGNFNAAQISALLSLKTPLADLYDNWLDTDVSYMDMLRDTVDEYADAVIRELAAEKSKAQAKADPAKQQQRQSASKEPPSLLGEIREAAREVEARKAAHTAPTTTKSKHEKEI